MVNVVNDIIGFFRIVDGAGDIINLSVTERNGSLCGDSFRGARNYYDYDNGSMRSIYNGQYENVTAMLAWTPKH